MTESGDIGASKRAMRAAMRARIASLVPEVSRIWSGTTASLLYPRLSGNRRVMLYWPLGIAVRGAPVAEVDLRALISSLIGMGAEVTLPRTDWDRGIVEPRIVRQPPVDLVVGRFGVSEPAATCAKPTKPPEVVIAPGLAFDREGGRLGRGAGFYDRFVASLRREHPGQSRIIGVCFGIQVVDRVPREATDEPMDEIWTEGGRIWERAAK
ncbi:MAG: 5-formyltetrahydrofolate cyclo-ligase [Phycisphaeraceae bacterium]|nr:MAG: 5-formyltetrahydrofolate cyclo-ligase [Phycisphaeraceae bacterium]